MDFCPCWKHGYNLSNKYGRKRLDSGKKSTTDAIKTASKRAIQKTAEATGDLIGNKIADKITSVSTELHSKKKTNNNNNNNNKKNINNNIKHEWNKKNHVSTQHINLYELSEVTASFIKYTGRMKLI